MKKIIIAGVLVVNSLLQSMEPKELFQFPQLIKYGDFFRFENEQHANEQRQSTSLLFDQPFCCPVKTRSYDDTLHVALVKKSLFQQLCVQASKKEDKNVNSFFELLTKIKQGAIDISSDQIAMTRKDLCYRLLANIYSQSTLLFMVGDEIVQINNKRVLLGLRTYETEKDKIKNDKIGTDYSLNVVLTYSGMKLVTDYYFETDQEHHARIVKEFKELLHK